MNHLNNQTEEILPELFFASIMKDHLILDISVAPKVDYNINENNLLNVDDTDIYLPFPQLYSPNPVELVWEKIIRDLINEYRELIIQSLGSSFITLYNQWEKIVPMVTFHSNGVKAYHELYNNEDSIREYIEDLFETYGVFQMEDVEIDLNTVRAIKLGHDGGYIEMDIHGDLYYEHMDSHIMLMENQVEDAKGETIDLLVDMIYSIASGEEFRRLYKAHMIMDKDNVDLTLEDLEDLQSVKVYMNVPYLASETLSNIVNGLKEYLVDNDMVKEKIQLEFDNNQVKWV